MTQAKLATLIGEIKELIRLMPLQDAEGGISNVATYLTPRALAKRLGNGTTLKQLSDWRAGGTYGLAFHDIGGRILYNVCDVVAWEDERNALAQA